MAGAFTTIPKVSFESREPKSKGVCCMREDCTRPAVGQVGVFFMAVDACRECGDEWSEKMREMHRETIAEMDRQFIELVRSCQEEK